MAIEAYCDGACRGGNPGNTSCAFAVYKDGRLLRHESFYLGPEKHTNNYAEYMGLVKLLEYLDNEGVEAVRIYCDSQLVVKQVLQEWACNKIDLRDLMHKAYGLFVRGRHGMCHIRGHHGIEGNEFVDKLCNEKLDEVENGRA